MPTRSQHLEEMQTCPFCGDRKKVRVGVISCGKKKCESQVKSLTIALGVAGTPADIVKSHRLERELALANTQYRTLVRTTSEDSVLQKIVEKVSARSVTAPVWGTPTGSSKEKPSFFCVACSAWHLDEVVNVDEMDGLNAYNRAIGVKRLHKFFDNVIEVAFDYLSDLKYDGLLFALNGDIFSGIIHEELRETNESTMFESILFWRDHFVTGILKLLDRFPKIKIPCTVGNHGRTTMKPPAKLVAEKNLDWLFYMLLADKLMDHPKAKGRIEFQIPQSREISYKIFGTQFNQLHGDTFRGGSGIAAALSPMLLGQNRKALSAQAAGRTHEYMLIGHWHTLIPGIYGILCNGSGVGYNEYALMKALRFEPPQQLFWIVDPKYGVTIRGPVHCLAKDENWKRKPIIIWGDRAK